jgi:hypothetical protein
MSDVVAAATEEVAKSIDGLAKAMDDPTQALSEHRCAQEAGMRVLVSLIERGDTDTAIETMTQTASLAGRMFAKEMRSARG